MKILDSLLWDKVNLVSRLKVTENFDLIILALLKRVFNKCYVGFT